MTCQEASLCWLVWYNGLDGDGDWIPCENVCHEREQVRKYIIAWHDYFQEEYWKFVIENMND